MENNYIKIISSSMSEDIRSIGKDFLKAKIDFKTTGLDGINKHQNYKYAKLGQIYNAAEGALEKNNIFIIHCQFVEAGIEYLDTRLLHAPSNQWFRYVSISETEKPGNQAKGAANTYMRKLAVLNLCAIAAEEDDDCEEEQKYMQRAVISTAQLSALKAALDSRSNGLQMLTNIKGFNKINELDELPLSAFGQTKEYIIKNGIIKE